MDSKLNDKHLWALTPKAKQLYNYFRDEHGLDDDLAFELVELHLGDEQMYELGEDGERRPTKSRS